MTKNLSQTALTNFDFSAAKKRIGGQGDYDADEINLLITSQVKPDVALLPSAIAVDSTPDDATQRTNFQEALALFKNQKGTDQIVCPINLDNHLTGLHVTRGENGKFQATYVDPMGTTERAKDAAE